MSVGPGGSINSTAMGNRGRLIAPGSLRDELAGDAGDGPATGESLTGESLTGLAIRSEEDLVTAARCGLEMLPGSSLLVTRGHRGMASRAGSSR